MILIDETIKKFKILSQVNEYLVLKENSNHIRVINNEMNVVAETYTKELFPRTVVFDVNKFLGVYQLFNKVNVVFDEKEIRFIELDKEMSPTGKEASIINIEPKMVSYFQFLDKSLNLSEDKVVGRFVLEEEKLKELKKASNIFGINFLAIRSENDKIVLSVEDMKRDLYNNPTTDKYKLVCDQNNTTNSKFELFINFQNLSMLMSETYNVKIYNVDGKYKLMFEVPFNIVYYVGALVR